MNKLYVTLPLASLLVFGGIYWNHAIAYKARLAEHERRVALAREARARDDAAARLRAAEEAHVAQARRTAERLARERIETERKDALLAATHRRTLALEQEKQAQTRLARLRAELDLAEAGLARLTERHRELEREQAFLAECVRQAQDNRNAFTALLEQVATRESPPPARRGLRPRGAIRSTAKTQLVPPMNKFYLIAPLAALGIFIAFQRAAERARTEKERVHAFAVAETKRLAAQRDADRKLATQAEFLRQAAERERQEQERVARKQREFDAAWQKLTGEADAHALAAAAAAREVEALAAQLAAVRTAREAAERDTFTLAQEVERHRTVRRTAELEVQRATRVLVTRLEAASVPPAPPAVAGPRL